MKNFNNFDTKFEEFRSRFNADYSCAIGTMHQHYKDYPEYALSVKSIVDNFMKHGDVIKQKEVFGLYDLRMVREAIITVGEELYALAKRWGFSTDATLVRNAASEIIAIFDECAKDAMSLV